MKCSPTQPVSSLWYAHSACLRRRKCLKLPQQTNVHSNARFKELYMSETPDTRLMAADTFLEIACC